MNDTILITGGTGYIGSHTAIEFMNAGYKVVLLDNLSNSSEKVLARIQALCGPNFYFINGDIRNESCLDQIFQTHKIDGVIHFAGLKAVGESMIDPLLYFDNNVVGSLSLLRAMVRADIKNIVFSSSATVYGDPIHVPIPEFAQLRVNNTYGRSKLMCEDILRDLQMSDSAWRVAILRYFNPVGAHVSGLIGEHPHGSPNNLMPFITQVAVGKREYLSIFGDDYPTVDGTGVRDYIHVTDLAQGHLAAWQHLVKDRASITVNLGTGRGVSVKELIGAFTKVTGVNVPYQIVSRREGDVPSYFADTTFAEQVLGWKAKLGIERMCEDAWRWQSQNPDGYR
jgi:UDP-glucose 4-epimerase